MIQLRCSGHLLVTSTKSPHLWNVKSHGSNQSYLINGHNCRDIATPKKTAQMETWKWWGNKKKLSEEKVRPPEINLFPSTTTRNQSFSHCKTYRLWVFPKTWVPLNLFFVDFQNTSSSYWGAPMTIKSVFSMDVTAGSSTAWGISFISQRVRTKWCPIAPAMDAKSAFLYFTDIRYLIAFYSSKTIMFFWLHNLSRAKTQNAKRGFRNARSEGRGFNSCF